MQPGVWGGRLPTVQEDRGAWTVAETLRRPAAGQESAMAGRSFPWRCGQADGTKGSCASSSAAQPAACVMVFGSRAAALDVLPHSCLAVCSRRGCLPSPCARSCPMSQHGAAPCRRSTQGSGCRGASRGSVPCAMHLGLGCRPMQVFVMRTCCCRGDERTGSALPASGCPHGPPHGSPTCAQLLPNTDRYYQVGGLHRSQQGAVKQGRRTPQGAVVCLHVSAASRARAQGALCSV
jgi:hypothetical protein